MNMTPQTLEAVKAMAKALIDACVDVPDIARIRRAMDVLVPNAPPPTPPASSP